MLLPTFAHFYVHENMFKLTPLCKEGTSSLPEMQSLSGLADQIGNMLLCSRKQSQSALSVSGLDLQSDYGMLKHPGHF